MFANKFGGMNVGSGALLVRGVATDTAAGKGARPTEIVFPIMLPAWFAEIVPKMKFALAGKIAALIGRPVDESRFPNATVLPP